MKTVAEGQLKGYSMNKTDLNKKLVDGLTEMGATEEQINFVDELTKPKAGGSGADVNDYTAFDGDGDVTHVFCTYHKKWEPVADEEGEPVFKENEKSKNGYARECTVGLGAWREQAKVFKSTKDGVIKDLLDGEIENDSAKELLAAAEVARAEHSEREDGLGEAEKPVA